MKDRSSNALTGKNGVKAPITILIVEDDPGLSELIGIALEERGWKTTIAFTGAAALREVAEHHPALLLLDYSLPDMSAAGFIEAASRQRIVLPPFIVATGRGDERIAVDMMKRGARDYIVKDSQFLNALGLAVERTLEQLETERRLTEAERSLHESEERYRLLFDNISEAVYLYRVSREKPGKFIAVNETACRMLGYTQEKFRDMDVTDIDEPEQEQRLPLILRELFMEGYSLFKTHHVAKDGRRIPVEISARLLSYEGTPAVLSVVRDISERKRAAKRLKEAEQKFETLFTAMNEMAVIHQLVYDEQERPVDYRIIDCNPAFSRVTGIPGERAAGALASELYGTPQPPYLDIYAQVVQSGKPVQFDTYYEPMGKYFSISAFRTGQQQFGTLATDITERKRAEEKLHESMERNAALLRSVPDLIFLIGKDGTFLDYHANDPLMLFLPPAKFLRRHVSKVFSRPFAEQLEAAIAVTLLTDEIQTLEYQEEEGGQTRHHEMRLIKSGEEAVFMIVRDISRQKQAEEVLLTMNETLEERVAERTRQLAETNRQLREARAEADRANKAKSVFLASMSHEIRTPLNAVLGYTQFLRRSEPLTDTQREYLSTILRSGEHLLELINQVLELSKIEAGRITLNPADFDLHQLLADVRSMFRVQATEKGLSLDVRHEGTVPRHIHADGGKIRQVLINVVGNAMKFTKEGGIMIAVRDEGPTHYGDDHLLAVDIVDTGPGMTAEETARVFDHFEQTSSGVKSGGGTGLGLALSKQFATLMEGTLSVTSTPGEGSTFTFRFRALPAQQKGASEQARFVMKPLPPGVEYRVLIVDDNASNRDVLRLLLEEKGFLTAQAVNGRDAVTFFQKWRPALIFMDLRMPEMDGMEAIRRIRELPEGEKVPIIVITASALEETQEEVMAVGASGFMRKPFREEELCSHLLKYLNIECGSETGTPSVAEERKESLSSSGEKVWAVPAPFRAEMRDAVIRGDNEAILRMLDRFPETDRDVVVPLRSLVEAFDYETLLKLTEERHE
ncbi:MAG TPA: response regulator [bacterium]|nr:response regulator [bacterium]